MFRFEIGDKVVYDGRIAIIEDRGEYIGGDLYYELMEVADYESTCTAPESECEKFI